MNSEQAHHRRCGIKRILDTDDKGKPCLSIRVDFPYAEKSKLLFVGKKQKIFQLDGPTGLDLIGPIEEQIREQSSEHRSMPDLPATEKAMAHRALLVSSDATTARTGRLNCNE